MAGVPTPCPCPFMFHGQDFQLIKEPPFWVLVPAGWTCFSSASKCLDRFWNRADCRKKLPRGACGKMVLRNEGA